MADAFPITDHNRVRRKNERAHYDRATVHAVLDAAMLCHIAYVIDGQPYCTSTAFWREGDTLLWHASSASRALRAQTAYAAEGVPKGVPVCLTVSHMDAIVLARCGFNHSINYRSVMAFGRARLLADPDAKRRAMDGFVDRFFPGRSRALRAPTAQEIKATGFVAMPIDSAVAKIRDLPPHDDDADYAVPAWTALIPLTTVLGEAVEDARQHPAATRAGGGMALWRAGARLEDVLTTAARAYEANDAG